ncbi:MAG: EscF/YscF/HrpA family type III secretion system needle major subunit [Puniceicoccales bacterium]|jgi:hypothetical protein|nr:EscF/YscF/HrpA family type III secretion system needle major subunit [Puniceicoccales bacterium]
MAVLSTTKEIISKGVSATQGITMGRIWDLLASAVSKCETKLNSAISKLEAKDDIGQEQLLALQAKIQSWGNLTSTATGLMRAVGDALKTTTQNIR